MLKLQRNKSSYNTFGLKMNHRSTHHINKLTEPESELHGQFIRVVTDRSDQFVVSTLTKEVII